jgi:hypothetical protein
LREVGWKSENGLECLVDLISIYQGLQTISRNLNGRVLVYMSGKLIIKIWFISLGMRKARGKEQSSSGTVLG